MSTLPNGLSSICSPSPCYHFTEVLKSSGVRDSYSPYHLEVQLDLCIPYQMCSCSLALLRRLLFLTAQGQLHSQPWPGAQVKRLSLYDHLSSTDYRTSFSPAISTEDQAKVVY
jgi:hypothetical protein